MEILDAITETTMEDRRETAAITPHLVKDGAGNPGTSETGIATETIGIRAGNPIIREIGTTVIAITTEVDDPRTPDAMDHLPLLHRDRIIEAVPVTMDHKQQRNSDV